MSTTTPGPMRLHHNASVTDDQEATRKFYEDVTGMPLVATWAETDVLFGAERTYCHTFFALTDGSALAFFQFADPADRDLFKTAFEPSPFRHIALAVDQDTQDQIRKRIAEASITAPNTFVLDHGYCVSLYVTDPNGLLLEFTVDHPDARGSTRCERLVPGRTWPAGWRETTRATTRTGRRLGVRWWPTVDLDGLAGHQGASSEPSQM